MARFYHTASAAEFHEAGSLTDKGIDNLLLLFKVTTELSKPGF